MKVEWSKEWPTERGYYWFYGDIDENDPQFFKLDFAEVCGEKGDIVAYIGERIFLQKGKSGINGFWAPVEFPDIPSKAIINDPEAHPSAPPPRGTRLREP